MGSRCVNPRRWSKGASGQAGARLCGAEQRRVGVGARTRAHPKLTREHCLSETSAASEASCERDPNPSEQRIRQALSGNLCRCGTYVRVRAAVKDAAAMMRKA